MIERSNIMSDTKYTQPQPSGRFGQKRGNPTPVRQGQFLAALDRAEAKIEQGDKPADPKPRG